MKNIKILIVEDEIITAEMINDFFSLHGCTLCKNATTGEEAIQTAQNEKPDLILMDYRLAGALNGLETARSILKNQPVKIIFMTGYNESEILPQAKDIKPLGYFQKPLLLNQMAAFLETNF